MLEYRIEEKAGFTLAGLARTFRPDTSYQDIPRYWLEVMDMARPPVMGTFGVCIDGNAPDGAFEYLIADIHTPGAPLPPGCVLREIPALTWAVFPCRGPLPDALQEVNTRMWGEWLPNTRAFRLAANLNVEAYFPQKDYCELWLPVERVAE